MKTGFVAVVVLSLAGHSPVYGQDPGGSGGVQCVNQCFDAGSGDTGIARSAVQQLASENQCTEFESTGRKVFSCVEACPLPKYAVLARKLIGIWEKYCGDGVDVATREKFLADTLKFQQAWTAEWGKCPAQGTTPAETCAWSGCVFGRALTTVTNGFPADVISVNVNAFKLNVGLSVEGSGEYLPSSCEQITVPYQPEPPTEPELPYPYEPYQPEPYLYEAYQRAVQITGCILDYALTTARSGFSGDLVSINVNWFKMVFGISTDGESLPSSCNVVFEPCEPEPSLSA